MVYVIVYNCHNNISNRIDLLRGNRIAAGYTFSYDRHKIIIFVRKLVKDSLIFGSLNIDCCITLHFTGRNGNGFIFNNKNIFGQSNIICLVLCIICFNKRIVYTKSNFDITLSFFSALYRNLYINCGNG